MHCALPGQCARYSSRDIRILDSSRFAAAQRVKYVAARVLLVRFSWRALFVPLYVLLISAGSDILPVVVCFLIILMFL